VIVPQAWITAALSTAAGVFGPVRELDPPHRPLDKPVLVRVVNLRAMGLPRPAVATTTWNGGRPKILIAPRVVREGREVTECALIHEYGHLTGRQHSRNPRSIMYLRLDPARCHAWLKRHHVGRRSRGPSRQS